MFWNKKVLNLGLKRDQKPNVKQFFFLIFYSFFINNFHVNQLILTLNVFFFQYFLQQSIKQQQQVFIPFSMNTQFYIFALKTIKYVKK